MAGTTEPEDEGSEVSSIIRHDIKPGEHEDYETWLQDIVAVAKRSPGHLWVNVIRPVQGSTEYTIILHFDSIDNLRLWLDSPARRELVQKVLPKLVSDDRVEIKTGFEFWFTPRSKPSRVPAWKQCLVTLSIIYPLTILVPLAINPIFVRLSFSSPLYAKQFVVDSAIVALITFVIMPRYVRLIAKWLYR